MQLNAALDRARATLVCAVVGKRQVKPAELIAVRRVDCHAVKPVLLCAARRDGKVPDDLLDILTGYLLRHIVHPWATAPGWGQHGQTGRRSGCCRTRMVDLRHHLAAILVDGLHDLC